MVKRMEVVLAMGLLLMGSSLEAGETQLELWVQVADLQKQLDALKAEQERMASDQRNQELVRQMLREVARQSYQVAADSAVTAGYEKHFFIKSAGDQFKLEIDTRLDFRHSYLLADDGNNERTKEGLPISDGVDASGSVFELERARMTFQGHVLKDVKYKIQLDGGDDNQDTVGLLDYIISYSFRPELGVKVGRDKAAFGKQENTSSGRQTLVDRSLANEVFNLDRSTGLEVFGTFPFDEEAIHYRAGVYNGFQDIGSTPSTDNDNSPALATRVTLHMMGSTPIDFKNESDLAHHENPVVQLGVSFAYTNDRDEDHFSEGESDHFEVLAAGGDGKTNIVEAGGEVIMVGADYSFKHQGLSMNLEGFYQHADLDSGEVTFEHDFGGARDVFGLDGFEFDNWGWTAQAGYFLVPKTFELVGRISGVCVDNSNNSYEYAGGWNWYFAGQDLKLSMDVTYIDDLPMFSDSPNFDGVQNNGLLLVRTQFQFMF